jgi:hypothetical protein
MHSLTSPGYFEDGLGSETDPSNRSVLRMLFKKSSGVSAGIAVAWVFGESSRLVNVAD